MTEFSVGKQAHFVSVKAERPYRIRAVTESSCAHFQQVQNVSVRRKYFNRQRVENSAPKENSCVILFVNSMNQPQDERIVTHTRLPHLLMNTNQERTSVYGKEQHAALCPLFTSAILARHVISNAAQNRQDLVFEPKSCKIDHRIQPPLFASKDLQFLLKNKWKKRQVLDVSFGIATLNK